MQPRESLQIAEPYKPQGDLCRTKFVCRVFVEKDAIAVGDSLTLESLFYLSEPLTGESFKPERAVDHRAVASASAIQEDLPIADPCPQFDGRAGREGRRPVSQVL